MQELLDEEVQRFIEENSSEDPHRLLLKYKHVGKAPIRQVVAQLVGKRKAQSKLPTYARTRLICYPPSLNLEQSSSEPTALFKSKLFSGERMVDLTGGFGVDSLFFAKRFLHVDYVEPDLQLLHLAQHNHTQLGARNISYHHDTAAHFLSHTVDHCDLIYLDPSRRAGTQKVVRLQDYSPDVTSMISFLLPLAENVLIKTSPLLDIQFALESLQQVKQVYIVAVENECKELLFHCSASLGAEPRITAVDLANDGTLNHSFSFLFSEERDATVEYAEPKKFLYEPNASILKAGAFKSVAHQFQLKKLAPNTHFYTADFLMDDFPGRTFEIISAFKPDAKIIKQLLPSPKANVISRNYPLDAVALRKKLKLQDGGEHYVIACSGEHAKSVLLASRIK